MGASVCVYLWYVPVCLSMRVECVVYVCVYGKFRKEMH